MSDKDLMKKICLDFKKLHKAGDKAHKEFITNLATNLPAGLANAEKIECEKIKILRRISANLGILTGIFVTSLIEENKKSEKEKNNDN